MTFDSHFVIYPLGTEQQWVPQKYDVNFFHKLAYFISRGVDSWSMGPNLENKVDGTRKLRYHPHEISLRWRPCTNGHYQFNIDWLQSLK